MRQSKYDPYLSLILKSRGKGETWVSISQALTDKGVTCNPSNIRRYFLQRRKEGRRLQEESSTAEMDLSPFLNSSRNEKLAEKESDLKEALQTEIEAIEPLPVEPDWMDEIEKDYLESKKKNKPRLKRF